METHLSIYAQLANLGAKEEPIAVKKNGNSSRNRQTHAELLNAILLKLSRDDGICAGEIAEALQRKSNTVRKALYELEGRGKAVCDGRNKIKLWRKK